LDSEMMGGIVMYRTTKVGAEAPTPRGSVRFDEIRETIIPINKIIPDPARTRYVQYRLTLKDGDPALVFPNDARQSGQPGPDKNSMILNVYSTGPNDGTP